MNSPARQDAKRFSGIFRAPSDNSHKYNNSGGKHILGSRPGGIDTYYVRTYTVYMNITLSIDENVVARARKRAEALGKSLNQLIRDYLQTLADDDPERSIEEFKRLSGRGNSRGWRFNRDEIHDRS